MKKLVLILCAATLVWACKNEEALSKVDPNSKDITLKDYSGTETNAQSNGSVSNITTTPPVKDGKYPTISFSKKEHDFGTIKEGEKVETTFTFTNNGEADLLIANAAGSCGCTVPEFPKEPIKPGKSGKMKVSFDSNGKPGMQQKTVTITANTATGTETLTIKANVTPKAQPAPEVAPVTQ
jgi:hypothetical protein